MKFTVINPKEKHMVTIDAADLKTAQEQAGLDKVDHGLVMRDHETGAGISIVVYEFGLFVPAEEQHYFSLNGRLYAGNAVLYSFDFEGNTIDVMPPPGAPVWFDSLADVEAAIAAQAIPRPRMSINAEVIWEWPAPPPSDIAKVMTRGEATT